MQGSPLHLTQLDLTLHSYMCVINLLYYGQSKKIKKLYIAWPVNCASHIIIRKYFLYFYREHCNPMQSRLLASYRYSYSSVYPSMVACRMQT